MTEVVARARADQGSRRSPRRQSRLVESVHAAVMRHLQNLHRIQGPLLGQTLLGRVFGVSSQDHIGPARAHGHDHAGVVCRQPQLAGRRPQHVDRQRSDLPRCARRQRAHRAGSKRSCRRSLLGEARVRDVGRADPADANDAGQPVEPSRVVVVIVCEHDLVQTAHAVAREGRPQHRGVGARVHEHGGTPVAHEDRIALPDVQHDDFGAAGRRPDGQKRRDHDREGGGLPRTRRRTGPRPHHPDGDQRAERDTAEHGRGSGDRYGRAGQSGQRRGDVGREPQRQRRALEHGDSRRSSEREHDRPRERHGKRRGHQRHDRQVGERGRQREHAERRDRDGGRGRLADQRDADGR